jgi:hypothetical protein
MPLVTVKALLVAEPCPDDAGNAVAENLHSCSITAAPTDAAQLAGTVPL